MYLTIDKHVNYWYTDDMKNKLSVEAYKVWRAQMEAKYGRLYIKKGAN